MIRGTTGRRDRILTGALRTDRAEEGRDDAVVERFDP
jgi:hypothetical protein